ncbi:Uncharacterised protein [Helicobacter fennelliae]|uniref:Uncharacterized protein n=1 Tax=Helicobacter fennelliae TaxID=215 RepID=A0A2X3ERF1_9HELI|nr:hypothetical protein [Helicobacter fennelliae]SQC36305.1 Uncharacterised protein [Helicobacter fennelliae]
MEQLTEQVAPSLPEGQVVISKEEAQSLLESGLSQEEYIEEDRDLQESKAL